MSKNHAVVLSAAFWTVAQLYYIFRFGDKATFADWLIIGVVLAINLHRTPHLNEFSESRKNRIIAINAILGLLAFFLNR